MQQLIFRALASQVGAKAVCRAAEEFFQNASFRHATRSA